MTKVTNGRSKVSEKTQLSKTDPMKVWASVSRPTDYHRVHLSPDCSVLKYRRMPPTELKAEFGYDRSTSYRSGHVWWKLDFHLPDVLDRRRRPLLIRVCARCADIAVKDGRWSLP